MKKKILSAIISMIVVLSFTACSDSETLNSGSTYSGNAETSSKSINFNADDLDSMIAEQSAREIDWSAISEADEFDFMVEETNDGVKIVKYLG